MSFFSSTESPDVSGLAPSALGVTLATGRTISLVDVTFEPSTNRFMYGAADVTPYVLTFQRRAFPSYDESVTNAANSEAVRGAAGGSTSVVQNFLSGVSADVTNAATATREFITGTDGQTSSLKKWLIGAAILAALYFAWQLAKAFRS